MASVFIRFPSLLFLLACFVCFSFFAPFLVCPFLLFLSSAERKDGKVKRGRAGDDRRSPRRGHEAAGERSVRVQAEPGHHGRRLGDHLHEVSYLRLFLK